MCGAITAIMTGEAYEQSARMARVIGPFPGYRDARCSGVAKPVAKDNVKSMLEVIDMHRCAVAEIPDAEEFGYLKDEAAKSGTRGAIRETARLSQRASHSAGADWHDQLPDGLRHHRNRTRYRARKIQAARRRRNVEDRQSNGHAGAGKARLQFGRDRAHHRAHRRFRHNRRCGRYRWLDYFLGIETGASADFRLRLQAGKRRALVRLHGASAHDGSSATIPERRHFQDREHAGGGHGG